MSTAAYEGEPGDGKQGVGKLTYIPYRATLSDGTAVEVDTFKSKEEWFEALEEKERMAYLFKLEQQWQPSEEL